MDCPDRPVGVPGDILPFACLDDYRSSGTHADDVRGVMARLREEHGIARFYLLRHSQGTISARWLTLNLGSEIASSLHSVAVNIAYPKEQYASVRNFPYDRILTPVLHAHHEQDACRGTPYAVVTGPTPATGSPRCGAARPRATRAAGSICMPMRAGRRLLAGPSSSG